MGLTVGELYDFVGQCLDTMFIPGRTVEDIKVFKHLFGDRVVIGNLPAIYSYFLSIIDKFDCENFIGSRDSFDKFLGGLQSASKDGYASGRGWQIERHVLIRDAGDDPADVEYAFRRKRAPLKV